MATALGCGGHLSVNLTGAANWNAFVTSWTTRVETASLHWAAWIAARRVQLPKQCYTNLWFWKWLLAGSRKFKCCAIPPHVGQIVHVLWLAKTTKAGFFQSQNDINAFVVQVGRTVTSNTAVHGWSRKVFKRSWRYHRPLWSFQPPVCCRPFLQSFEKGSRDHPGCLIGQPVPPSYICVVPQC